MKSIKYNSVEPYLSHDEYHSISDALGSTGVKTIYSKSVAHYKFQEFVQKVHFDVGTAVHIAVLEPDKFDNEVIKCGKNRMTKEYKELKKNKQSNQVIVTDIEYDKCLRIRDSIHYPLPKLNAHKKISNIHRFFTLQLAQYLYPA